MQPLEVNTCHLLYMAAVRGRVCDGVNLAAIVCVNMQSSLHDCLYIMPVHARLPC
jgi:hypothetical protein